MKKLYLFSMINKYTMPFFLDFIDEASKQDFNLLVLMQIKAQKNSFLEYIKDAKIDIDIEKIHFLAPEINDIEAPDETEYLLDKASGIIALGGNAYFYQKMYGKDNIAQLVYKKYQQGVPYAGVSAGGILALSYGLVSNIVFKPHFTEKKRFNELLVKIRKNRVKYGFGLDDNMAIKITDMERIHCLGKDSLYIFTQEDKQDYFLKILKNQDTFSLI